MKMESVHCLGREWARPIALPRVEVTQDMRMVEEVVCSALAICTKSPPVDAQAVLPQHGITCPDI